MYNTTINTKDKTLRRRVLGDSVYDIYFLEMTLEDFGKYVSFTENLTQTEVIGIFQHFSGSQVAGLKWKKEEKRKPNIVACSRFDVADTFYSCCRNYDGIKSDARSYSDSQ